MRLAAAAATMMRLSRYASRFVFPCSASHCIAVPAKRSGNAMSPPPRMAACAWVVCFLVVFFFGCSCLFVGLLSLV